MHKQVTILFGHLLILALISAAEARSPSSGQNLAQRVGLAIHLGAFMPTDDFEDVAKTGFHVNAAVEYYLSRNATVGLDFSFSAANAQDSVVANERNKPGNIFLTNIDVNYHTYRLGIFGRYNVPTGMAIRPYLEAGTGIYWINRRVSGSFIFFPFPGELSDRRTTNSFAGGHVGVGLNARLSPHTNLYTGFQFHQFFDESPSRNYVTLTLGLGVRLEGLRRDRGSK